MNYCQCSIEELQFELRRRGYNFIGTRDQLGEALKKDDDARGSEATTVTTKVWGPFVPRDLNSSRTAEFGKTAVTSVLVDESMQGPRMIGELLTVYRSRLLDDEHILLDSSTLLRLRSIVHHRWQLRTPHGNWARPCITLPPYRLYSRRGWAHPKKPTA
jgi:hypothetical protein